MCTKQQNIANYIITNLYKVLVSVMQDAGTIEISIGDKCNKKIIINDCTVILCVKDYKEVCRYSDCIPCIDNFIKEEK